MQDKPLKLDWTQWLCPGPRRVFTDDEMARAGQQPWPKSIDGYVLSNVLLLLVVNYQTIPRGLMPGLMVGTLVGCWLALQLAHWLWKMPTRWRLNAITLGMVLALLTAALVLRDRHFEREQVRVPALIFLTALVLSLSSLWFLTIFRVQQIEARLRELADQEATLKLARRLATAQIQPHFLFNTLASLQHWVDTRDERAGPTLSSFTRYLRATLPMFERETLSLAEELQIVRSYLDIMQARLGARLRWEVQADPALDGLALPPGALLTLVENAIAHGIEPALRGGRISISASQAAGVIMLDVRDDGAGLCDEAADPADSGIGLANTRTRLQQQFGERARLSLTPQTPGCLARIEIQTA